MPRIRSGAGEQPVWCVLSTDTDGPADQVRAGQALARVLLTATSLGLASSVQSAPVEVPGVRAQIERWLLSGAGHAQAVIRVGWPDPSAPPPSAPHRPPVEVLVEEPPD